jgi:low affinity Fe/Cu permease
MTRETVCIIGLRAKMWSFTTPVYRPNGLAVVALVHIRTILGLHHRSIFAMSQEIDSQVRTYDH